METSLWKRYGPVVRRLRDDNADNDYDGGYDDYDDLVRRIPSSSNCLIYTFRLAFPQGCTSRSP